jgi:protein phosphatase
MRLLALAPSLRIASPTAMPLPPPAFRLTDARCTHVGKVRTENQDFFALDAHRGVFLLADGMGGRPAGGTASRLAVRAAHDVLKTPQPADHALSAAFQAANAAVWAHAKGNRALLGMGTTLVAARVAGRELRYAHVGDSRAYLGRNGMLRPLTRDHSDGRHLLRAVGIEDPRHAAPPDENSLLLREGDKVMLCSDGLWSVVDAVQIATTLYAYGPIEGASRLVDLALKAGAPDNVTVVVVQVGAPR